MIGAGFDVEDTRDIYNNCDVSIIELLVQEIKKQELAKRLKQKIDTAQAFNYAYVGSKDKKASKRYGRWLNKLQKIIDKVEGRKVKQATVWDRMSRKSHMIGAVKPR